MSIADFAKTFVPIVISVVALYVALRDRWPHLALQSRKGDWAKLGVTQTGKDVMFQGIIEIYNVSSRANVIRHYEFWCKRQESWEKMENERYHVTDREGATTHNVTPLALAPYSGIEVNVMAFTKVPMNDMPIRIEVVDLFGKRYRVEVTILVFLRTWAGWPTLRFQPQSLC